VAGHPTEHDEKLVLELRSRLRRNPNDVDAMVSLGAFMFEPYHRSEDSIRLLRQAIAVDRSNVSARFWLAKCLFHLCSDSESAREVLADALAIDADRPECLSLMASVLQDLGHGPAQCVGILRTAVQKAPGWTTPRQQLVQTLIELGDLDEAYRVVRESPTPGEMAQSASDSLEEYFESAVTGRAWPNAEEELRGLLADIERRRARRSVRAAPEGGTGR
jgi:hypothetical protein